MAGQIPIKGYLDFLQFSGYYYYMHDLELRNLIDGSGANGIYEPNIFPVFVENTFYEKEDDDYILLSEEPLDWEEEYQKYYFLNVTGVSSNRETISTSYVIFNALSKKLDVTTFEQFQEAYDYFVEHIQEYIDIEDVPPGLGARVEGTDLVFSGPSYGGMTADEDENLAELIGSGVL